jgi:hypothetical protein
MLNNREFYDDDVICRNFIHDLYNDAISSSNYVTSDGRIIKPTIIKIKKSRIINLKGFDRSSHGLFQGIILAFTWRDWGKTTKIRLSPWLRFELGISQICQNHYCLSQLVQSVD